MSDLKITLIQSDLVWENAKANLNAFSEKIKLIPSTDLIILPETFSTGFSMDSEKLAEPMDRFSMQWMAEMAKQSNAVIAGSLILKESGKIFNRFIWMRPDGTFEKYDKRHLFTMGNEHNHYTNGQDQVVIELKGWRVCPQICYDLRFPVWSRNDTANPFDLLLYVANWPEVRIAAWEKLLYARAIENQCFVAAVNRIGVDGEGVNCIGNSMLIDSKGEPLWKATDSREETKTISISKSELEAFRVKFPVLEDGDEFILK